jgi:DNA-binding beta-propeller fold protein YncE
MNHTRQIKHRALFLVAALFILTIGSRLLSADTGSCGGQSITLPFTDVPSSNIFFCAIAQAYFSGLTNGTSATTYSPTQSVPREQMAAFIARTQDSALKRGNRRAAMQQWWTPTDTGALRAVDLGSSGGTADVVFDGEDLWTANNQSGTVSRVHASDGRLMQTWTGALVANAVIAAVGRIFVAGSTGNSTPGKILVINPEATTAGPVSVGFPDLGVNPRQITFDGSNLWTANSGNFTSGGSITRVAVATGIGSTFSLGFVAPSDVLWDGANLWVCDGALKRVDASIGSVLESIEIGAGSYRLLFDGTNLWVTNFDSDSVSVVRAVGNLRGTVLATLTGNGLNRPSGMAFDGERVLVCNSGAFGPDASVSLFKAADFAPLGSLSVSNQPEAACHDGVNFWVARYNLSDLVRF